MSNYSLDKKMLIKLRARFCAVAILVLVVMQGLIVFISVSYSYNRMIARADVLIDTVYKYIEEGNESDIAIDARYFYIINNKDGKRLEINTEADKQIKANEARAWYKNLRESGENTGFYNYYRYRIIADDDREIAIFIQRHGMIDEVRKNAYTLIIISSAGILVMLVFLIFISKFVVRPIASAYKKQKEFISSASHELKTPITVILADADLLDMCLTEDNIGNSVAETEDNIGNSIAETEDNIGNCTAKTDNTEIREWTEDIKLQANRLKNMVNSLVTLARLNEKAGTVNELIAVSELAMEVARDFEVRAVSEQKSWSSDIEAGVFMRGELSEIKEVMNILCDNAFKYAKDKTPILFTLSKAKNVVKLSVVNSVENPSPDLDRKMFDRFYRDPNSASEISGHGLGLSIAKEIVNNHKGEINAKLTGSQLEMTVKFKAERADR